jgi:hypothetical protein
MAGQYVAIAEPLTQESPSSRSFGAGKATFYMFVGFILGCAMLWAFDKDNEQVVAMDPAVYMATNPLQSVRQPSRSFMQPVQEGRRAALTGLAVLPFLATAEQARADKDKYIDELLKRSKDNMAKNNADRLNTQKWNGKRFSADPKLKPVANTPGFSAMDVKAKVKSDFQAAEIAGKP